MKQMKATTDSNDEYKSDTIDSDREVYSNDIILAFIAADEEDTDERPVTIRSGRTITSLSFRGFETKL